MPRVTNAQAAARREQVAQLWVRGIPLSRIAASLGSDWATIKRDVVILGERAAQELDVGRELTRLLLAGRAVEADAWTRGEPMKALAAQRQQLGVLQVLLGQELALRVEALEARLDGLAGGAAASLNGRARDLQRVANLPAGRR